MTDRPNVIVILADDLGYGDLGIHGNTVCRTPNLDRLGHHSLRIVPFYVHAVCAPTRASLLTGRHYLRTGVSHVHGGRDFLHPREVTIADWFRHNGYRTGMWGKWHSGKTTGYFPWERGFDEAYMADLYQHEGGGGRLNGERIDTPGWTTAAITDMALDFAEKEDDRPSSASSAILSRICRSGLGRS
jgi:arylsulfatase A-like enzyme